MLAAESERIRIENLLDRVGCGVEKIRVQTFLLHVVANTD